MKKTTCTSAADGVGLTELSLLVTMENGCSYLENRMAVSYKGNIHLLHGPTILLVFTQENSQVQRLVLKCS